jgi:hypothetical protein
VIELAGDANGAIRRVGLKEALIAANGRGALSMSRERGQGRRCKEAPAGQLENLPRFD